MPCYTPFRDDSAQLLLFKIASCLEAGGGISGVASFNGRTGVVTLTSGDVISALGFTPISQADGDSRYVLKAGDTMTGALVHPVGTAALPSITFTGDLDTGIYHPVANTVGLTAGGTLILAVAPTGVNLTTALAYQYNSVNVIRAQTALNNFFFGPSGNLTSTGTNNTAVGFSTLPAVTSGVSNSAFGVQALLLNTSGSNNVAIGRDALRQNTIGTVNTAVGGSALDANTDGSSNVAVGFEALLSNTSGAGLTAIGIQALRSNTTANNNAAVGFQALYANTTGVDNAAWGALALTANTTGGQNMAIGRSALADLTTGSFNTGIGYFAGGGITTGSNNTILGANVTGLAAGLANNIIIADGAGNQRITVGSTGVVTIPIALTLATAAPLSMASGANQRAGNAVLVAGTVTVANTSVTANTVVLLTRKTSGGTIGFAVTYTVIAATSFTITSDSALDTSTYSYLLIEVP